MFPTNIDITLYQRQTMELVYRIPVDLTDYDVYFLVKLDKQAGSTKIIEKISTSPNHIGKSYTYPYSYLTVNIFSSDTAGLTNERYYYELYAVNKINPADLKVYYYGNLALVISVSTPTDTTQSLAVIQYYTMTKAQRLALGSTLGLEDEGMIVVYDTDDDTIYTWTGVDWR